MCTIFSKILNIQICRAEFQAYYFSRANSSFSRIPPTAADPSSIHTAFIVYFLRPFVPSLLALPPQGYTLCVSASLRPPNIRPSLYLLSLFIFPPSRSASLRSPTRWPLRSLSISSGARAAPSDASRRRVPAASPTAANPACLVSNRFFGLFVSRFFCLFLHLPSSFFPYGPSTKARTLSVGACAHVASAEDIVVSPGLLPEPSFRTRTLLWSIDRFAYDRASISNGSIWFL